MNRSQNREQAFKLLYSMTFLDEELDIDVKEYVDVDSNEDDEDTIEEIDDMEINARKSKK